MNLVSTLLIYPFSNKILEKTLRIIHGSNLAPAKRHTKLFWEKEAKCSLKK